jgi:hypothetical protein
MFFSRSTVKIEQDSSSNKDNLIHVEGLTDRTPNNTPVNFEEYQEMMNDNCIILQDTKFIFLTVAPYESCYERSRHPESRGTGPLRSRD